MKYDAFISYSHSDCGNIAPEIQRALENIGKPWYSLKRNLEIFRDETNLTASPELWNSIVAELDNSDNLILLASPIAKDSLWVNKEIEYWCSKKRKGELFIVLAEGYIAWDYSINDFDWRTTNCLPKAMIGKFKSEPLWIDLSEYINTGRESINYKQAGFTSALTKIIGRIVGKPPREIESDELSRKRKTTFALFTSSFFFIILLLLGFFFYIQNRSNQKNSDGNKLIAEGNKYNESDINKAFLLYAYAFSKNNDLSTFKLLKLFYDENNVYAREEYEGTTEKNNTIIDTLNVFYRKIKEKELPIDTTVDSDEVQFPEVYLNIATRSYIKIIKNRINIYSLSNSKFKSVRFPYGKILQLVNIPNSKNIYILTYSNKGILYSYNIATGEYKLLITKSMIKNPSFLKALKLLEKDELNIRLTKSELNTNLIIYTDWFSSHDLEFENTTQEWLVYNIKSNKLSYFSPIKKKSWVNYIHSYESVNYFEQDSSVFFNLREHNDVQGCKSIYENISTNYFSTIYEGDSYSNNLIQQPTVSTYSNRFIYGNYGGNIITYFDEGTLLLQRPKKFPYPITSITTSEKYIFAGTNNGVFHIFINQLEDCVACIAGDHYSIRTVKLPNDSPIIEMDYVMNKLFLVNREGEIYRIDLNQRTNLINEPQKLLRQIFINLGIKDLTRDEKKRFNIND